MSSSSMADAPDAPDAPDDDDEVVDLDATLPLPPPPEEEEEEDAKATFKHDDDDDFEGGCLRLLGSLSSSERPLSEEDAASLLFEE